MPARSRSVDRQPVTIRGGPRPDDRPPQDQRDSLLLAQFGQQPGDLIRILQPDAEYQRIPRQDGFVHRVVDDDSAYVFTPVRGAVRQVQQRGAEIVDHPGEAGAWGHVHRYEHLLKPGSDEANLVCVFSRTLVRGSSVPTGQLRDSHSVLVLTASSTAGSGSTPMPGAVGTSR